MTAEEAMAEIWAITCCDCGPEDYKAMVDEVAAMQRYLDRNAPTEPGGLPPWLDPGAEPRP